MQIPLELKLPVKASFDDFVSNQKQEITSAIQELINKFEHHFIFLSGANATGKTHLLSALCQSAETADQSIIYLPLQQADEFPPEICEGIETADIISTTVEFAAQGTDLLTGDEMTVKYKGLTSHSDSTYTTDVTV